MSQVQNIAKMTKNLVLINIGFSDSSILWYLYFKKTGIPFTELMRKCIYLGYFKTLLPAKITLSKEPD